MSFVYDMGKGVLVSVRSRGTQVLEGGDIERSKILVRKDASPSCMIGKEREYNQTTRLAKRWG